MSILFLTFLAALSAVGLVFLCPVFFLFFPSQIKKSHFCGTPSAGFEPTGRGGADVSPSKRFSHA